MTSLLFILAGCWVLSGATVTRDHMFTDVALNNKVFTENITFEITARSEVECSVECSLRDACVTFTFHQKTCRGHSIPMTLCSASKPVSGAIHFVRLSHAVTTEVKRLTNVSLELDMDVLYDGGWLVFQKRQDGSVDFFRTWEEYANGFGSVHGEFWLGLEPLHRITTSGVTYDLRVRVTSFNGTSACAFYSNFSVGPAADFYRLHYSNFLGGAAGDSLWYHRGMKFSTFDSDNDGSQHANCPSSFHGAWWYDACYRSNLNGRYGPVQTTDLKNIFWKQFTGGVYLSLKSAQMMIRPEN